MNTYCSRSPAQRARESMRESRSRRRDNEKLQVIQHEQNEDIPMDTSNIMNQVTTDITDDPNIATVDYQISSPLSESANELELNSSDAIDDDLEYESDNDDIEEFIVYYDLNNQTKLFSSCPLSIREACQAVIKLARCLNLDKNGIKHLLDGIRCLFPTDVKLPRTVKGLMKIIGFDCSKEVVYHCCECLSRLQTPEQSTCTDGCPMNNKRRPFMNVIELATNDVKHEICSTAKRYLNLINEYSDCVNAILPCDVPNGSLYERLRSKNKKQLTIMLHADGAPVTKMGGKSLWPVQATILEIPPPVRDHIGAVMIFGAWLAGTHPNRELLWDNIVAQLRDLYENGIIIKLNDNTKLKFDIRVQLITFDLPALAHCCNIIQFNGYDACPFCKVHGYPIGKQIYYAYSPTPSPRMTDDDYLQLSMIDLPRLQSMVSRDLLH